MTLRVGKLHFRSDGGLAKIRTRSHWSEEDRTLATDVILSGYGVVRVCTLMPPPASADELRLRNQVAIRNHLRD